ncbi:MAG TPA: ThuA domain-containing protein [Tepidisphaeraceae bacterium]|nr:ThuA domain-containing protein [Tepidisphaeraceae bacterium]
MHQPRFTRFGISLWAIAAGLMSALPVARAVDTDKQLIAERPIRVVVWDEQQPQQKQAYDNFLGNAIADHLKTRPGLTVKSVRLADEQQGLGDDVLDHCDVLVWWGHVRNAEVTPETGKKIVERIKAGKLSLIALHSAHWSAPFVEAMHERTTQDALKALTPGQREKAQISYVYPKRFVVPKRTDPLTPSVKQEIAPDGTIKLEITMPNCVFPAYRPDGKPSHVKTLLPEHPIAAGVPREFDVAQTEMYDEPFHVPAPDAVIFEEHWDQGEHFRSGCLWDVGKGKVFYFRPGHEIYPVYKQEAPLKIIENAVRYLGSQLPK